MYVCVYVYLCLCVCVPVCVCERESMCMWKGVLSTWISTTMGWSPGGSLLKCVYACARVYVRESVCAFGNEG